MTPAINAALRTKFCAPEWALFFEVGDATGGRQRRWADAVAMNLYQSRGLSIQGFEVKAYRGDWLRELKDPTKSAPVQQYCDHWWIVTLPGIVKSDELPATWGLYELKSNGLHVIKQAPKLEAVPMRREFVAAMLRRASEADQAVVGKLVEKEVERERAQIQERINRDVAYRTREWEKVQKRVAEIKEHCGIDLIHGYDSAEDIGRVFRLLMSSGVVTRGYGSGLRSIADQLGRAKERLEKALHEFESPAAQPASQEPA